ncbi:MAG: DUF2062 domain-containing protein [Desulfobulbaceae bacterium]|nr:DUF2062 domain-containing protein [Desulfobulbaceae bacterium]
MKNSFPRLLQKFRQLQGSPASLAQGTAVGIFIGMAPLMPFKSVLIVVITMVTGGSTVAALLVCTILCNPLTYVPLYYLAWLIGNLLLSGRASWETLQAAIVQVQQVGMIEALPLLGQMGFDAGIVLLAGGCILALPPALCSYPIALRFFGLLERKRSEKHLLNAKNEAPAPRSSLKD